MIKVVPRKSGSNPDDISRLTRKAALYCTVSILVLGVGFAALALFADIQKIMDVLAKLPLWTVASVMGLALFNYAVRAWRFKSFGERLSLRAPYPEMFVYYVSGFAMSMSPGKLGEMARLWFLKRRYGFGYHNGVVLQIADRVSDVCASLLLCVIGMTYFAPYRGVILSMVGAVIAGLAFLMWPGQIVKLIRAVFGLVKKRPRLFVRLEQMVRSLSFMFRPSVLPFSLIIGMMGWGAECYALYIVLNVMGASIEFLSALFIFSFSSLAGGLTMLPGGLGGVEFSMVTLLVLNRVPPEIATAATIVVRLCTLWFGVILGFADIPLAIKLSARRRPPSYAARRR